MKKYRFGISLAMIRNTHTRARMNVKMKPNKARRASLCAVSRWMVCSGFMGVESSNGPGLFVVPLELFRGSVFVHILRRHQFAAPGGRQHFLQFPFIVQPAEGPELHKRRDVRVLADQQIVP